MAVVFPTLQARCAFTSNPMDTPIWTDISTYLRSFTSTRGRQFELDRIQAGTSAIVLNNQARNFDPYNTSSPYNGYLIPKRRFDVLATWNSVQYPVFSHYVEEWQQMWDLNGKLAVCNVTASDGLALLGQSMLNAIYPAEFSGSRVAAVLSSVNWGPAGNTAIGAGTSFLQSSTLANTTALEHLQNVAVSEYGRFFMSRSGVATFLGRTFGTTTIYGTFGDAPGELEYTDLVFGAQPIWNDIRLTATGGLEQVADDAVSIATYFWQSKVESGYLQANDGDLLSLAEWWLNRYKDAHQRITSITIAPSRDPTNLWPQVLGRELGDHILVRRRPPGGGPLIEQESVIEQIVHTASNHDWTTQFSLSPAEPTTGFLIIGSGLVGTGTIGF